MQINTFDFSNIAALFDLDGVILDTESQYTIFWENIGLEYLGKAGFGTLIKGQTLTNIFENHFSKMGRTASRSISGIGSLRCHESSQHFERASSIPN